MSSSFAWWADAGMTVPLARLNFVRDTTPSAVDAVAWFGSPVAGQTLRRQSAPGVDPLQVEAVDAASGSGVAVSNIRLALSSAGLSSATPGAALNMPATINAGTAIAVYVRVDSSIATVGNYDDVTLQVGDWLETGA